jgi:hypothetical protein
VSYDPSVSARTFALLAAAGLVLGCARKPPPPAIAADPVTTPTTAAVEPGVPCDDGFHVENGQCVANGGANGGAQVIGASVDDGTLGPFIGKWRTRYEGSKRDNVLVITPNGEFTATGWSNAAAGVRIVGKGAIHVDAGFLVFDYATLDGASYTSTNRNQILRVEASSMTLKNGANVIEVWTRMQ